MAKPSLVVVLVEDRRQQQVVLRYLRSCGLQIHAVRFKLASSGSGEQWVRERFPDEVTAYRGRSSRAESRLIVVTDADKVSISERLAQLGRALTENNIEAIRGGDEQIAMLIPRRNIETWILCLNGDEVNEDIDYKYKRSEKEWEKLIRPAADTLYGLTRQNAPASENCVPSLQHGVTELRRLDFRAS